MKPGEGSGEFKSKGYASISDKFKPKVGSWECGTCLVSNSGDKTVCVACGTLKPGEGSSESKSKGYASISDKFKPKVGSWECGTCLVSNSGDKTVCVACGTLKPGEGSSESKSKGYASISDKFKPKVGSWECGTCLVSNSGDKTVCVACGTLKPGEGSSESKSKGYASISDKFKPKVGSWECGTCLVSNSGDKTVCVACGTLKPGEGSSESKSKGYASISDKFKPKVGSWECGTCLVSNSGDKTVCVACGTLKPGEGSSESKSKGYASISDKFKPKVGSWECDTCLVSNSDDKTACVACGTAKPTQEPGKSETAATNNFNPRFHFGTQAAQSCVPVFGFSGSEKAKFLFGTPSTTTSAGSGFVFAGTSREGDFKPDASSGFVFGGKLSEQDSKPADSSSECGFVFGVQPKENASQTKDSSGLGFSLDKDAAPSTSAGFVDANVDPLDKFKPKTGSWECDTCFVSNGYSSDKTTCVACGALKPGQEPCKSETATTDNSKLNFFCERAKLYRFDKDNWQWKEHGVGDIKLFRDRKTGCGRVVMKRDQIKSKQCANHVIGTYMNLMPNVGCDRSWVWHTSADYSEGDAKPEQLAVRLKSAEQACRFKEVFDKLKEYHPEGRQMREEGPETDLGVGWGGALKPGERSGEFTSKGDASISNMFKPKPGSWECDTCSVSNSGDKTACVACGTAKPGQAQGKSATDIRKPQFQFQLKQAAPPSTGPLFGFGVQLKESKSQTKGSTGLGFSFDKTAAPRASNGFVDANVKPLDKFKPKPGSWECDTCSLSNSGHKTSSAACGAAQPGQELDKSTSATTKPQFQFGTTSKPGQEADKSEAVKTSSEKPPNQHVAPEGDESKGLLEQFKLKAGSWECDTCLVNNSGDKTACVACGTAKPGQVPGKSATATTKPLFQFWAVQETPSTTPLFDFGVQPKENGDESESKKPKFLFGAFSTTPSKGSTDGAFLPSTSTRFVFGANSKGTKPERETQESCERDLDGETDSAISQVQQKPLEGVLSESAPPGHTEAGSPGVQVIPQDLQFVEAPEPTSAEREQVEKVLLPTSFYVYERANQVSNKSTDGQNAPVDEGRESVKNTVPSAEPNTETRDEGSKAPDSSASVFGTRSTGSLLSFSAVANSPSDMTSFSSSSTKGFSGQGLQLFASRWSPGGDEGEVYDPENEEGDIAF